MVNTTIRSTHVDRKHEQHLRKRGPYVEAMLGTLDIVHLIYSRLTKTEFMAANHCNPKHDKV